ncbi:MAG: hypothetical protein A3J93_04645 [Candidatus Magasanikbacteria bacterium RIFOXYC2_FULL_42_28]|uniref:Uncharacterized protein n=1 Tax=Candidatus Magasanikbacteria bacterium RIFOXYC2_FULL_42_28 TaxID=1798704 RepID=A0A1F6NXS9_9BACT|nr:MAG: hypothetical protein A3J93_04645 [Candidatus Magasanikbacteria bacterium RIFOXYC2_FULL_42_28]
MGQGRTVSAIAYDLKTSYFYTLNNFPTGGVWNNAGTKAFIMPNNSAGAGATNDVIHGYAVGNGPGTDAVRSLTTEKASAETSNPTDVSGSPLPYWANVNWIDNNTISATLVDLQGNASQLVINFNDLQQ